MRFLADENFKNQILRGLLLRVPDTKVVRAQDTELYGKHDVLVLEWAAEHDYIVLTHDVSTLRGYYYERIDKQLPVPGVFLVHDDKPVKEIIDSLEMIVLASDQSEWRGEIRYLPL